MDIMQSPPFLTSAAPERSARPDELPPIAPAPLEETDFALIREAAVRRRAIKKAARTAKGSAVVTLVIAISAAMFVLLSPSWLAAAVAGGLCVIGVMEYRGYRLMRQADPAAPKALGNNQLAFGALIVLYCTFQMFGFSPEKAKADALSPEVRSQLSALPGMAKSIDATIEQWAPLVVYGFYGLVIFVSLLSQGGLAIYYFTRKRPLDTYLTQTPPWVRQVFIEAEA